MVKKKTRLIIVVSVCIYTVILLIGAALILAKVNGLLVDYENSQPEYSVEREIANLRSASENGMLDKVMELPDSLKESYDPNASMFVEYVKLLKDDALTFHQTISEDEMTRVYYLMLDDLRLATMTLRSTNERTTMFVFQSADWVLESIVPVVYTCDLSLAKGLEVRLGESVLSGESEDGEMVRYHVESLIEPHFSVTDDFGYTAVISNEVSPDVYTFRYEIPEELTVMVDGKAVPGILGENGNRIYQYASLKKVDVCVKDSFGHSADLSETENLNIRTFTATLPTDYTISVAENTLSYKDLEISYFETYQYFKETYESFFADLDDSVRERYEKYYDATLFDEAPGVVTYSFRLLMVGDAGQDIRITAPDGNDIPFDLENGFVEIRDESVCVEPIPEKISQEIDVREFSETWAKFLTKDLPGKLYGFNTIADFLLKDSALYTYAYKWATGSDINFTSDHTLAKVPFTDESFDGFRAFGENCFLCNVRLTEHMVLRSGQKHSERIQLTVCFIRVDQTDDGVENPKWVALALRDLIEAS